MKKGSRYHPLFERLQPSGEREITLSFADIEALIGGTLPASARTAKAWWSNRSTGAVQAKAWIEARYHVKAVDLQVGQVTFYRPHAVYSVHREGDTVLWNGDLVKALRMHMSMTQGEFAQKLGIRQQTVSEWEKGIYTPTRASSTLLSFVAKEASFEYIID